jgi:hypothetical protein
LEFKDIYSNMDYYKTELESKRVIKGIVDFFVLILFIFSPEAMNYESKQRRKLSETFSTVKLET